MIKRQLFVRWSLFLISFIAFSASANERDEKETRHLAAKIYFNCLSEEGARVLSRAANTKPNLFEKIAATLCKDHEDRLGKLLQLDVLIPQLQQKQILNRDAQRVIAETIEQTISGLRRSVVISYAEEFDKRHPGLRSCSLIPDQAMDEKLKYFCAVRD